MLIATHTQTQWLLNICDDPRQSDLLPAIASLSDMFVNDIKNKL